MLEEVLEAPEDILKKYLNRDDTGINIENTVKAKPEASSASTCTQAKYIRISQKRAEKK